MTDAQKRRIQWITNRITAVYGTGRNGFMSFEVSPVGERGELMLVASNNPSGLRWFETHYSYFAFIGVRGGTRQFDGNINVSI